MICEECGRDINEIGQDNCSPLCGYPVCEDCANDMTEKDWARIAKQLEDTE